jgi:hypothetical protein
MRDMNAQEHYREAERLVVGSEGLPRPKERDVARAQVHATLALAAATAVANGEPLDETPGFPIRDP